MGYKWYKFINKLFNGMMETRRLQSELETDKTIQHIAQESILNSQVLQAHPQFVEIYQLEEQNLLYDVGRQAGKLMGEVPSLPGASEFSNSVFDYYGRMRDDNNARIEYLVQDMLAGR